jgi:hypothetical protein
MISVHPSREMTRKMAVQALPTLSKEMAPWKGLLGPERQEEERMHSIRRKGRRKRQETDV